ncbi:MAG: DUF4861 domain-containing protein [Bacteroidales bacterium]|nr:DUF4861 domain-containing protein [Bacteroidales bacterium]
MRTRILYAAAIAVCLISVARTASAQIVTTAKSLYLLADEVQVNEIVSEKVDMTAEVGHLGPAVENTYSMFRLLYNDSGAVDVYSKTGRGMELIVFKWYPTESQREDYATGVDQYVVGNTLGLGGFALWDGSKVVNLVATRGRTARVGETKTGSYAELIAYGVPYKGEYLDVSLRIEVSTKTRRTTVTATELNGKKVQFVSGVNYHEDAMVDYGTGHISVWGVHPSTQISDPQPVGGGLFYDKKTFPTIEQTEDMVRIISKEVKAASVEVIAASTIEAELNTLSRFQKYMSGEQTIKAKTSRKSGPKKGLQLNNMRVH